MDIIRHSGKRKDLKLEDFNGGDLATVATTGSYTDLINKPTIPPGQIQSDWNETDNTKLDFIKNKPTGLTQIQSDWNETNNTLVDYIKNKPVIPAGQIQSDWTQGNFLALDYIKNKPTIPATQLQSNWTETDSTKLDFILNKPTVPTAQIQSDWTQTNTSLLDYIKHKPSLATVATTGSYSDLTGTPTVPAQFNPIAGAGIVITGTYPNETFTSTSSGIATSLPSAFALGILANGTDQTSAINTILANSLYAGIIFDFSSPANVTISGTIQGNGKILRFVSGSGITGTNTINNVVIDASMNTKCFSTSSTITNSITAGKYFSVKWFGATGNGSTDDIVSLQKSSDTIIANHSMTRDLYIPSGVYVIGFPWMLHNWDGTKYAQYTINLIGDWKCANSNLAGFARILPSYINGPAIGVQRATSGSITGISIEGAFLPNTGTYDQFVQTSFSSLIGSMRTSQYSPACGIAIDVVTNGQSPIDGGYPQLNGSTGGTNWYRGDGSNGGTTDFLIKDCHIIGFTVCILNSPTASTKQGEDCIIDSCRLENCGYAIAYCQAQNDNCHVKNCRSWNNVWIVIDTFSFGEGKGLFPSIDGYNVAGTVNTLFNGSIAYKSVRIQNFYAESFFQIGTLICLGGSGYLQGTFHFGVSNIQPQIHFSFYNVEINSSTLIYYDNLFNKRIRGSAMLTTFTNCSFDLPPFIISYYSEQFNSVDYTNCNMAGSQILGPTAQVYSMTNSKTSLIAYGNFCIQDGTNIPLAIYSYKCPDFNRRFINFGTYSITPDTNRQATITSTNSVLCYVNDIFIDNVSGNVLGRISAISGTSITISEIPINITAGSYQFVPIYIMSINNPLVGDTTNGSTSITNVSPLFPVTFVNNLGAGFRFDNPSFPVGTYIVSYDATNRILTMSANASITASRQNFVNGFPKIEINSPFPPSAFSTSTIAYAGGTIWYELTPSTSLTTPNKWLVNKGGYPSASTIGLSSSYQADINKEPNYRISSGSFQYYDNTTNTWINV